MAGTGMLHYKYIGIFTFIMITFSTNTNSAEFSINPRISLTTDVQKIDSSSSESQYSNQQHMQLGLILKKNSKSSNHSFNGQVGLQNSESGYNSASLTRAVDANISFLNPLGALGLTLSTNKNNFYQNSIENISVSNSLIENVNSSVGVNLTKTLSKKHSFSVNSSFLTAESQSQGIKLAGSDTYGAGMTLNYRPVEKTTLNGSLQLSKVFYADNSLQIDTSQASVGGNRKTSARLNYGLTFGIYATKLNINGADVRRGNTASLNLNYLTGANSSLSFTANKELETTNFGNYVDRQIVRSNFSRKLSKRTSLSAGISLGINQEQSIQIQRRTYSSFSLSSSQQILRNFSIGQSLIYGKEKIDNVNFSTETWRASLSLQYSPRRLLLQRTD